MKYILMIACIMFISCHNKAIESVQNGDFNIELLFEKDGCKMYRFKDGGRYIYWSDCRGGTNYSYKISNGSTYITKNIQQITDSDENKH